jgi:hypothetical protein
MTTLTYSVTEPTLRSNARGHVVFGGVYGKDLAAASFRLTMLLTSE